MNIENKYRLKLLIGITCLLISVYVFLYDLIPNTFLLTVDFILFIIGWFVIISSALFWINYDQISEDEEDNEQKDISETFK